MTDEQNKSSKVRVFGHADSGSLVSLDESMLPNRAWPEHDLYVPYADHKRLSRINELLQAAEVTRALESAEAELTIKQLRATLTTVQECISHQDFMKVRRLVADALSGVRQDETAAFQGWQPIETAPADGTEFIAFHKEAGVCACFRTGPESAWYCMDGWNTYPAANGTQRPGLTSFVTPPECWMPMPKPPGSPVETSTPLQAETRAATSGSEGSQIEDAGRPGPLCAVCDHIEEMHATMGATHAFAPKQEKASGLTCNAAAPENAKCALPLGHDGKCDFQ